VCLHFAAACRLQNIGRRMRLPSIYACTHLFCMNRVTREVRRSHTLCRRKQRRRWPRRGGRLALQRS
jgi:hypothetical protein